MSAVCTPSSTRPGTSVPSTQVRIWPVWLPEPPSTWYSTHTHWLTGSGALCATPAGTVPVWLSNPSQNAAVPQPAGGGPVWVGVGVGLVGVGDGPAPLHGTPSRAKSAGTAVGAELVAWKPKATVPPLARVPL